MKNNDRNKISREIKMSKRDVFYLTEVKEKIK